MNLSPRIRRPTAVVRVVSALLLNSAAACADNPPSNTWVPTHEGLGGTIAGITYLPDQQSMLYFGYPDPKSANSDLRLYRPASRDWSEPLPGRGPHRARGTLTTTFGSDQRPGLPMINLPYWLAHQFVFVPPLKKVLFFAGGSTFTYDPSARRWENLDIPLDQSPPDVMLGSMAWDPVGKRVILFGGGYISAYKASGYGPSFDRLRRDDVVKGKPWQPDTWTMAEKRATWAFDPATLKWSRLTTGSETFRKHFDRADDLLPRMETLAGAVRGIALDYGDKVSGKTPDALATDSQKFGDDFLAFAEQLNRGDGCRDAYERQQCRTAAVRLREAAAGLDAAARALREKDGWKALQALEATRMTTEEAREDIAPSPLPRYYGNLVTDTRNNLLVLFGGHGGDRTLADTWIFDPARDQWRQSQASGHPPPTPIPAMSFDKDLGATLLSSGWIYDASRDEWRRLPLDGPKGYFLPWTALQYDPVSRAHVALTTGDNRLQASPVRVAHLRLDTAAAKPADHAGPRWVWMNEKYALAWAVLPKTQAEYRARVAAQQDVRSSLPANTWTRITAPYNAQERSYGSFALDPDRGQIVLWGGGHSAYMGNEVSQYDIKSNLWLESWPPDLPPWPFGSPDGDGWSPPFYHLIASNHSYHRYAYNADLGKVLLGFPNGLVPYDPDRMRWSPPAFTRSGNGAIGGVVDMSGARGFYTVSPRYYRGAPFGVWRPVPATKTIERIPGSDTPFASNDRAKAVYDTKRDRILFYGARNEKPPGPANQLYAFDIRKGAWERLAITLAPPDTEAPGSMAWGVAYSRRHDVLMVLPGDKAQSTWLLDCASNLLRRLGPGPVTRQGTEGVVYSADHDLFIALEVGNSGIGPVALHLFPLRK